MGSLRCSILAIMIKDEDLPELGRFRAAERSLPIRTDDSFGPLVVATDNDDVPIHRWFRLKESFSPDLLETIITLLYPKRPATLSLLDTFAGVGTTLLSAQFFPDTVINAIGIERNPFIAFAAKTKLRWPDINPEEFLAEGRRMLAAADERHSVLPSLSSISTGRCITLHKSRQLIAIRDRINSLKHAATRDALLLGLAATIEPTSKIRRDGRALRIVERQALRITPTITAQWNRIASDCTITKARLPQPAMPLLLEGDGRHPQKLGILPASVDLVLTSPPYPNNIDYTEVYKLELWMLGFITHATDFLSLRRQTFRSHPTCANPALTPDFVEAMATGGLKSTLNPIFARAAEDPKRLRVFQGYFSDLWTTIKNIHDVLKPGGHAVLVVGNSLHGTNDGAYLLPTDLVIAQMATPLRFTVIDTIIARNLRRRLTGNHFLRESLVILQKTHGRQRRKTTI
jgi:DNA modification methylase